MKRMLLLTLNIFLTLNMYAQTWSPQLYTEGATPQFQAAKDMLDQYNFTGYERILDVGCGDGKVTALIAEKYCKNGSVVAVDVEKDMITFAQKKYENLSSLSFQVMDARALSFENEFDVVVSFFCLHWIEDLEKALHGILRSLKPGGTALIVANCLSQVETPYRKALKETKEHSEWAGYFKDFKQTWFFKTAPEFARLLSKVGFKITFADQISKEYIFSHQNAFLQWLNATPGNQNTIPEFLVDSFHTALIENYLRYVPKKLDGSIPFARPLFWAVVRK